MRIQATFALGICILISSAMPCHAASTDVCETLFRGGLVDTQDTYSDSRRAEYTRSILQSEQMDSYQKASSAATDFGVDVIDILDTAFGSKTTSTNYSERRSTYLADYSSMLASSALLRQHVVTFSKAAVQGALACVQATAGQNGFLAYVTLGKSLQSFTIYSRYVNIGGSSEYTINTLTVAPDVGVKCDTKLPLTVTTSGVAITCEKPASASVQVSMNTTAGTLNGVDVDGFDSLIKDLRAQVETLHATGQLVPKGTVSYFNLQDCPGGWSRIASAQGRYLVGLEPGGTLGGTQGIALEDLENRPTGNHTHLMPGMVSKNYFRTPGGSKDWYPDSAETRNPKPVQGMSFKDGTNAPYMQFLACERK